METLLDCIVLSHEKLNARLDSFANVLLKTSGVPANGTMNRDGVLFFQNIYNGNKDTERETETHAHLDLGALVTEAKQRHGL